MNLIQIRYILKAHESQFMIYFASRSAQENERKKEESNKKKSKKNYLANIFNYFSIF